MEKKVVEEWRPAPYPEWSELYEISDAGRVRRRSDKKIFTPQPEGPGGAPRVALYDPIGKRTKLCRLARLVLKTFKPEAVSDGHIRYEDENPSNCCLDNLSCPPPKPAPQFDENGNVIATGPTIETVAERVFCGVAPLITDALRQHEANLSPELLTDSERALVAARMAKLFPDAGSPELVQEAA